MFGFGARTIVSYGSGEPIFLTGFGGGLATTQTHSLFEGPFTLSSTSTYTGQSFTTLGVMPGTYEWTWGTGPNQNYTLIIGSSSPGPMPVPEPASAALLGAAVVGFAVVSTPPHLTWMGWSRYLNRLSLNGSGMGVGWLR